MIPRRQAECYAQSIIDDTFKGLECSEVRCLGCGRISRQVTPFRQLSVQVGAGAGTPVTRSVERSPNAPEH